MDLATKKHDERPKASALTIVNFLLLCTLLVFVLSLSSRIGNTASQTTTASSGASAIETVNTQQEITALSAKIDDLTSAVNAGKPTSTKPFNYLSCSGSITSYGSTGSTTSQCYPY